MEGQGRCPPEVQVLGSLQPGGPKFRLECKQHCESFLLPFHLCFLFSDFFLCSPMFFPCFMAPARRHRKKFAKLGYRLLGPLMKATTAKVSPFFFLSSLMG